jgi:hypothetical protein
MDNKKIWKGAGLRGLVVAGLTFFSMAIKSGLCLDNLEAGFIAGGMYMFLELVRYYKISLPHLPKNKKGNVYKFILLP